MDEGAVKYYIYHIPKRKEWGCTKNLNNRLRQLGYNENDLDRVIICGNVDMASELEKQMNIEYGYGWNETRDYRRIIQVAKNIKSEHRSKGGKKSAIVNTNRYGIKLIAIDKFTNELVKQFESKTQCANYFNVGHTRINEILDGRRKSINGLIIKKQ
jgi:hypothetical protein